MLETLLDKKKASLCWEDWL